MTSHNKSLVYRAGTVPYIVEDGVVKMLFMRPSDPEYCGDRMQIAKGKIEDGESAFDAALREAKEETGLFLGNIIRTEEVGTFMGRTTVFVAKVKNKSMFGEPSFETSDVAWMTLDEFMEEGRELHRPVVQACYRAIQKIEGT